MDEPITMIISNQLDIKLGQVTQEECDLVLRQIKNRKTAELDWITPVVWKTKKFDDILLRYNNAVYNQILMDKSCIFPFPKKGDHRKAKNCRSKTFTSIAVRIYNALLFNHIQPGIEIIL